MSATLTFRVELESDYHVSSGGGKGSELDSTLLRDGDNAPVLRGTTIGGLLRDALWRLLQLEPLQKKYQRCKRSGRQSGPDYCGQYDQSEDLCPICYLLGTPHFPKQWSISSARPIDIEKPIRSKSPQGDNHVIQRARINPRLRRTASNQLFSQENGDQRLTFLFTITRLSDTVTLRDEAALLTATARYVREFGRSRRRGQGACQIQLSHAVLDDAEVSQAELLTHFETRWLTDTVNLRINSGEEFIAQKINAAQMQHTKRFRLVIRLDEPLVIARRGEAANQFATQEIITGAAIRGAFAKKVAQNCDLSEPEHYTRFVELIHRNKLNFSTLHPTRRSGDSLFSAITAPLDLFTCKTFHGFKTDPKKNGHGVVALTRQKNKHCLEPDCEGNLERLSGLATFDVDRQILEPQKASELHIRLTPQTQRVRAGDLFGYTVLSVGQYFVGDITVADDETWQTFLQMTNLADSMDGFVLHLGKATRRGYGQVTACLQVIDEQKHTWIRVPFAERVKVGDESIVLTLLTDLIEQDEWGRFRISFERAWLTDSLKLSIETIEIFTKAKIVDGFNTFLGVPRQRDFSLVAGSTIKLHLATPLTEADIKHLQTVEHTGLGLRRNEGFGQVVFNHPIYDQFDSLRETEIRLDGRMRLDQVSRQNEFGMAEKFIEQWLKELDKRSHNWQHCRHEQFLGVPRWIYANNHQPLETIQNQIDTWTEKGIKPPQSLKDEIENYSDRPTKKINKEGLKLISRLLNELAEKTKVNEAHRIRGLKMLADRIAAEAKLSRKENSQ